MCAAKILFELTGSIAAWKACAVISRLVQDGHEVQTVATPSALRFVGAATLEGLTGRAVMSDLWERGAAMEHINLVKWAEVVVLCPATANTINSLAAGLADDLVGSLFLAHDWKKPFLIVPAMNPAMWSHPATVASVEKLRGFGVRVLPVARGRLACGDEGDGRMLEPDVILDTIHGALTATVPAKRLRVLITAGGTEEALDGVRTIGNFSTGRTGALLADLFTARGHDVTLLRAHRGAAATRGAREGTFTSYADLERALQLLLAADRFDAVIHAAAVSDYSVAALVVDGVERPPGAGKIGSEHEVSIKLRPNAKIVDRLRAWSKNPAMRVVAFKLTRGADSDTARAAVEKLFEHSCADAVVHNDLSELDEEQGVFPAILWLANRRAARVERRDLLADALERFLSASDTPAVVVPQSNPN